MRLEDGRIVPRVGNGSKQFLFYPLVLCLCVLLNARLHVQLGFGTPWLPLGETLPQ